MAGRVVLVVVSPRLPPGQLTWSAWSALQAAPTVCTPATAAQLPHLLSAGVDASLLTDAGPDAVLALGGDGPVAVVVSEDDAELVRALARRAVAGGPPVEQQHGSTDPDGARLLDVVAVMDRLRSPGGCPWDAEQTHASLAPYLLEEAYELLEAIEDGDDAALREELGDVLLQVVFHARLAGERGWGVDEVARDLADKLVRRHPHVFAGASADDLEGSWEALKQVEKGRTSVTEGVPLGQPALSLAAKLQRRATRTGAPVPAVDGPGAELWEAVRRCREAGLDPEHELRAVARTFRDALAGAEARAAADGLDPATMTPEQWQQRWPR